MATTGKKAWDDTRYIPGVALEFFKAAGKPEKVPAGKAFFAENEIPELSVSRVKGEQLQRFFHHRRKPDLPTDYD